jgi:hypothetical protein
VSGASSVLTSSGIGNAEHDVPNVATELSSGMLLLKQLHLIRDGTCMDVDVGEGKPKGGRPGASTRTFRLADSGTGGHCAAGLIQ